MRAALETVLEREEDATVPIILCADFQAVLATLVGGAGAQWTLMVPPSGVPCCWLPQGA